MYQPQDCTLGAGDCNTKTQEKTTQAQLESGSRYYDLRPVIYEGEFYTGHLSEVQVLGLSGCNGDSLGSVLDHVNAFLAGGARELVVLKFSHFQDRDSGSSGFSSEQIGELVSLVQEKIGGWLFVNETGDRLAEISMKEIIGETGKVIAVFDPLGEEHQGPGIYSYADYKPGNPLDADLVVYDEYSDTNSLDDMMEDQLAKLDDPAHHGGDMFLLSWTLTQSAEQAAGCIIGIADSIEDLAEQANPELDPKIRQQYESGKITLETIPNVLYVDFADGFATDLAVWLNRQL